MYGLKGRHVAAATIAAAATAADVCAVIAVFEAEAGIGIASSVDTEVAVAIIAEG